MPGGECEYKAGELASKVKRASDPSFEPLKKSDTVDQMLASPFRFDKELSSDDFEKLGRLSLRWSHIDHMIANCLKVLLGLNEDQARIMIFPLTSELRLQRIEELTRLKPLPSDKAKTAFQELRTVMRGIRVVRNNVIHAVLIEDAFTIRSNKRTFTREQIFETEELTNYAGILAITLRHELGERDPAYDPPDPLPARPLVPEFLKPYIPQIAQIPRR